jgi:hypothetical protein
MSDKFPRNPDTQHCIVTHEAVSAGLDHQGLVCMHST